MIMRNFILLLLGILLVGCSSPKHAYEKPVTVEPTVVQTSYDFVRPKTVATDQRKPVYICPKTLVTWKRAEVNKKTKQWFGGQYVGEVLEEGHWGTLEEAEMGGLPYIVPGEDGPIIPVPGTASLPPQGANQRGSDLQLTAIEKRLSGIECKLQGRKVDPTMTQEEAAKLDAAQAASGIGGSRSYIPEIAVTDDPTPVGSEVRNNATASPSPRTNGGEAVSPVTVVIPPRPNSKDNEECAYDVPGNRRVVVKYMDNNRVEINYKGKKYEVTLHDPNDQIRLHLK